MRIEKLILLAAWAACIGKVSGGVKQINSKGFRRQLPELNYHRGTGSVRRSDMVIDLLKAGKGKSKYGNTSKKASDADSPSIAPKHAISQQSATSTKAPTAKQGGKKGEGTAAPSGMGPTSRPTKGSSKIPQDSEDSPIPVVDSRPSEGSISYDSEDILIGKGKTSKSSKSKRAKKKKSKDPKSKMTKKSKKSSIDSSPPNLSPVLPPVLAPVLPPSVDAPSQGSRPPIPPVASPAPGQPQPTLPPNGGPIPSDTIRRLTPYGLEYTVTDDRIPFRSEYLEVAELTRIYLQDFFDEQFKDTQLTNLKEFLTIFTGSSFNFGEPIFIQYLSTAVIAPSSIVAPSVEVLDQTLSTAFEGENLNGFIGMLQSLPPGNVFSTTIFVNQTEADRTMESSASEQRQARATTAAGAVAGAAGLALMIAGCVYYMRHQGQESSTGFKKGFAKSVVGESATVAGETYADTWTIDQASESQPFQSSRDHDSTTHEEGDDDGDDDGDGMTECSHTPLRTNEITSIAMEWEGELNSVSLS